MQVYGKAVRYLKFMKTIFTCFFRGRAPGMSRAALLVVSVYASGFGTAYGVSVDDFEARWFTNAQGVLPYRLFIPTNYTSAERFPMVLFLHGAGERGSDNRYVSRADQLWSLHRRLTRWSIAACASMPAGIFLTDPSIRLRVWDHQPKAS
jgi:predicted peptidase